MDPLGPPQKGPRHPKESRPERKHSPELDPPGHGGAPTVDNIH